MEGGAKMWGKLNFPQSSPNQARVATGIRIGLRLSDCVLRLQCDVESDDSVFGGKSGRQTSRRTMKVETLVCALLWADALGSSTRFAGGWQGLQYCGHSWWRKIWSAAGANACHAGPLARLFAMFRARGRAGAPYSAVVLLRKAQAP